MSGEVAAGRLAIRALLAEAAAPGGLVVLGVVAIGVSLMAGQAVSLSGLVPGVGGLCQVIIGLLPSVLAVGLPVGLLAGVVAAGQSWAERGDWLALLSSGLSGRVLLPGLLLGGALCGGVEAGLTHALEPAGRRMVRAAMIAAAGEVTLRPGQPAEVGGVLLHAERVEGGRLGGLFIASEAAALSAVSGEVSDGILALTEGTAAGLTEDWTMTFARARLALRPVQPRMENAERSTASLRALIGRMEAEGRAASVERLALYKRTALAGSLPLLAALALPLGVRGVRPAAAATAVTLAWWAVMRICDQAVVGIGPLLAAVIPPALLALSAAVAWLTWRDA
jgi:lipopolysaccharide export LptBFGC system permease protein LptF